jgi:uncharacterized membrane protein YcaP (DUF421 family)
MAKKRGNGQIGHYAFLIGVLLALVLGAASAYLSVTVVAWLTSLLVIAGLLVGYFEVKPAQLKEFLLFATVLVIAAGMGSASQTLGSVLHIGMFLQGIFDHLLAFVVPATVIAALRGVLHI